MIKRWIGKLKVRLKARRIAREIYGNGKSQKAQRQRYIRGQMALWETNCCDK